MWWLMAAVLIGLAAVMAAAWLVQYRTGNAGWVDALWTFGTGLAGIACALFPLADAPGVGARQLIVAGMAAIWSLRLGLHIAERTAKGPEDVRYARFRREWAPDYERRMFGLLMIQALAAAVLALAMLVAARNPTPLGLVDLVAVLVMAAAIVGEALADRQMRQFRNDPASKGKVCDRGLWAWSRHPNYFFEWLGWLAYPLLAIELSGAWPWGWLALSAPALMYWLLVYVSGIPPLEREMVERRGDAYRRYQSRVSAFFPWSPQ